MEKNSLRIGFVGAGAIHFGRGDLPWAHATRLEKMGQINVLAIVDPDTNVADSILKEKLSSDQTKQFYQDCKLLTHFKDLIALKPDAVFIGIPPVYRGSLDNGHDIELQFIKAGIHVFVEKPLSVVPPEKFDQYKDEIQRVSSENNVIVSVGYMFRYHDAIIKMKELIKEHGKKVMAFNARYYYAYSDGVNKYWYNQNLSGGPIVEQATHLCDLGRYIVGDVNLDTVHTIMLRDNDPSGAGCLSHLPHDGEEDIPPGQKLPRVTLSHWRFQDGAVGTLMHSIAIPGSRYEATVEVQLDGMELSLIRPYEDECILRVRDIKSGDPNKDVDYTFRGNDSYYNELSTFVKAVKSGDKSGIKSSYEDASKTYLLTWKIRRMGEQNN